MAKVAVVTGDGSGVGRATALLLARHVGNVHVADPSEDTAQEVARASDAAGGSAVAHAPDVANPTLWRRSPVACLRRRATLTSFTTTPASVMEGTPKAIAGSAPPSSPRRSSRPAACASRSPWRSSW